MDNITAKVSCFARAYHYKMNEIHIFADEAAESLLGNDYEQIAKSMAQGINYFLPNFNGSPEDGLRAIVDKQLSPSVLGRSKFCEKMLENEIHLGCTQYVIFAAGYDTYAIRKHNTVLSVFELDLPEVLSDKTKRLVKANLNYKSEYIPCNLTNTSWKDNLIESGFNCDSKSFGSLLGISYYLSKDDFRKLLKTLGSIMPEGSAICFDYQSMIESNVTKTNRSLATEAGEEMKSKYSFQELEKLLADCGFLVYEYLNHEEMTSQYFSDYNNHSSEHQIEAPLGVEYIFAVKKLLTLN